MSHIYFYFFGCQNCNVREVAIGVLAVSVLAIEVSLSNTVFAFSIAKIIISRQQLYHLPVFAFLFIKIIIKGHQSACKYTYYEEQQIYQQIVIQRPVFAFLLVKVITQGQQQICKQHGLFYLIFAQPFLLFCLQKS